MLTRLTPALRPASRTTRPWMLLFIAPVAGGFLIVTPSGAFAVRNATPVTPIVVYETAPKAAERRDAAADAVQALADDASETGRDRVLPASGDVEQPAATAGFGRAPLSISKFAHSTHGGEPCRLSRVTTAPPQAPRRGPPAV